MKLIARIIILVGIGFLAYGGYELYQSSSKQNQSMAEAKQMLEKAQPGQMSADDMVIKDGDVIGTLYIPRLEKEIPIISGTDEEELSRGVGHYTSTVLPGQSDQILLSGHRDTVFRNFGQLENGDEFIVHMPYGSFTYEMFESKVVDANDRTVIRSTAPNEILTLSTCYPFHLVGAAPDRYIIYAKPVY
ncbi:class D sortase [Halalkalibacter krulwichiae]|uniref:Sortase family protein n=1 Tax=Halalkalibacter krulwichiae TaxID=199441 RepID=A0A1X9M6K5_9BACI|nr:class D sortase [Halalkalibacter krulwichiae]ARK29075.1 Sortase family protein [Halalkalibacter krulwichiae]